MISVDNVRSKMNTNGAFFYVYSLQFFHRGLITYRKAEVSCIVVNVQE